MPELERSLMTRRRGAVGTRDHGRRRGGRGRDRDRRPGGRRRHDPGRRHGHDPGRRHGHESCRREGRGRLHAGRRTGDGPVLRGLRPRPCGHRRRRGRAALGARDRDHQLLDVQADHECGGRYLAVRRRRRVLQRELGEHGRADLPAWRAVHRQARPGDVQDDLPGSLLPAGTSPMSAKCFRQMWSMPRSTNWRRTTPRPRRW
jgi:hypothetical protein